MVSKNSERKTKQTIALFVITFLITLMGVTYLIKSFSPNVDVEIGGEDDTMQSDEPQSDFKKAIDDRLKWIQLEDNMPGVSKRTESEQTDEITYETADSTAQETKSEQKTVQKEEPAGAVITLQKEKDIEYVKPQSVRTAPPIPTPHPTSPEPFKMTKVYVGHYSTIEQAIQAQNHLMNAPIGISPFVKEVNGAYVLQAGSFASVQKAESIAGQINQAGFSARVVQE